VAINGTNGSDTINGTAGNDIINGGNGNDIISGLLGDDDLSGGNGDDTISGGGGNDTIDGGNGNDTLDGGDGDDVIHGGNGIDHLYGGAGNDTLFGDNGDDFITGGAGDDLIDGNNGFDTAYYSGNIDEYTFYASAGYLNVLHLGGAGPDGHDRLIRVERLVFADRVIDLTGGTNNRPVAVDDSASTNEDVGTYSSGAASVKDNDFDFEGQALTVTGGTFTGTYGTLHLNANGTYTYTLFASDQALAQGESVVDSFNYSVSDGTSSDTGTLRITINGVNDAPVANPDTASGTENQVLTVNVLANDTDIDHGAILSLLSAAAPSGKGMATIVGNQVQFSPGTDFDHLAQGATETVVVNYTMQDEHGATSSSTLTITVTGTNDAPVAVADTASTTENAPVTVDVLANDHDVDDGAVLTVTAASAPTGQGTATIIGNQVRFDPGTDFDHLAEGATQVVSVSYTIQDEHGATSTSTVSITVTGTNDAPVAVADSATTDENAPVTVNVLANDHDPDDGAVLTVTAASAPMGQGTATIVGNQVQFNPGTDFDHLAAGQSQVVNVSYTIQDEHGATSTSTIAITVTGSNDAPVAVADTATTDENAAVTVDVLANDHDPDDGAVLTVTAASAPVGQGTATIVGNQVRFDPGTDFDHLAEGATQVVSVSYTIQDEHGATSTSTIAVTVTGSNDAPVAVADTATTDENAPVTINVLANDHDPDDGAILTVTAASVPSGQGTVTIVGNQVQFDPGTDFDHLAAGATQVVNVSYTIQDEHGATSTSTIAVTVTGSNDAPVAVADTATTDENAPVTVNVLANDHDPDDGAVLTVTAASAPSGQGTATVVGNQVQFDPGTDFDHLAAGATQVVNVSYTIQDEHGATSTSTVAITVTGSNDAPVAVADTATTGENAPVTVDVLANDHDPDDGAVLTVTAASAPMGQGTATVVGNQVQFDPGADFNHLAAGESQVVNVSYTIQDEHGATSTSTVAITVTGENDAPVAVADTATTDENSPVTVDVLANDHDPDDGAVLTVTAASAPSGQGTATIVGNQVQFDPGADFDHLAAGASQVVNVSYTIQDEHGATSTSTIAVTVTGTNDAPVAVADTATTDENAPVTINVLANDHDADDGAVLTVTAVSAPSGQGSATIVGNQVQFDPGADFDHLAVGESQVVNLSYTIQDEHGAISSSTVAVTVTGSNDAPVIDTGNTTASGSVTELPNNDPGENVAIHHADGSIAFTDADTSDTHSATATADGSGYLGSFTLDPVDDGTHNVGWHFSVSDAALDSLNAGDTLVQTYTVEVSDGHGGFADQDVTVTIHGAADNAAPVANDDSYSAIGNVTLTVPAATGVLANDSDDQPLGGGAGQTHVSAFDATGTNGGHVTMNPDGSFTYISAPGFNGIDSFTYTLTDSDGASDTATVHVSVSQHVWFIDNSAVGSANLGTEDNPYTSIAAFDAAQGTAAGPHAGDTIYLRGGTGTYAETDGIHLLNGQTLVGGGEDLVVGSTTIEHAGTRPTVTVVGAGHDGVDLAQNNHVSGFDIGTVTRAGISDSNGSVGTATVTDVGKSGGGQVVDIDQGGTVHITLSGAASTGSTGGAVDLENVSGDFTVSGATNIAGATGGGVEVIGGSNLGITFAGGLTASTGASDAVHFSGNTGTSSLAIAGLNLTTTSGTGLLAVNGGTVTVTGSANTIVSGTGSAVDISHTTIGGAGVTLQSVTSTGGSADGIILDTAGSGGFTVTGTAGADGSGGTISGKTGADGLTLQGIGVYINATDNVSLDHMAIATNSNGGVVGTDVANFALTDSTVNLGNGSSGSEAGISFTHLTGTASFLGDVVAGSSGDNLHIANSAGSLNLTIADSAHDQAIIGTNNNVTGNDGVNVQTSGSATLIMDVEGVDFLGARADLLDVNALGTSTQNITLKDNNFTNTDLNTLSGAGGVLLHGGGSNINVTYDVENNHFTGAVGSAFNASYNPVAGSIAGYIGGNVIGVHDGISGTEGSSSGGDGITVGLEKEPGAGDATYLVTVENNQVYDIAGGLAGISVSSSGGDAAHPATVEATVTNNIVAELGDFTLAAFYASVGAQGSGDFSKLGLSMHDNVLDASGATFGDNAIFLDQGSTDAHYYFPGYAGSPDGEFNGGTASADLDTYLGGQGNVMTNGGFASFPGGVDAGVVTGVTGDPLVHPPHFP
jgi:VCBS repeat-containing protein